MRQLFKPALRIGTDIMVSSRILSPHRPDIARFIKLTNRFLVSQELEDLADRFPCYEEALEASECQSKQTTAWKDSNIKRIAAWVSGRWTAKEAAKKAWGASLISFRDLKVETANEGAVQVVCSLWSDPTQDLDRHPSLTTGKVTEQVARLSISHDGDYTIATVLAEPLHSDIISELRRRTTQATKKIGRLNTKKRSTKAVDQP